MYSFDLVGVDGNVFDTLKTDDLVFGKNWARGRGRYFDIYTNTFRRYTVEIWRWNELEDMYIPFEKYLEE